MTAGLLAMEEPEFEAKNDLRASRGAAADAGKAKPDASTGSALRKD